MTDILQDDLRAAGVRKWRVKYRWTRPELYFIVRLRKAENARRRSGALNRVRYAIERLRYQRLCDRWAMTVPLGVFGPGLSIAHVGTLVINRDARVGARCRIHPGVTLGATADRAPVLGDDVFLAPGAGVFGGITVGDRVHIGPNAVVTQDVEAGALVVAPRSIVLNGYADRADRGFRRAKQ